MIIIIMHTFYRAPYPLKICSKRLPTIWRLSLLDLWRQAISVDLALGVGVLRRAPWEQLPARRAVLGQEKHINTFAASCAADITVELFNRPFCCGHFGAHHN